MPAAGELRHCWFCSSPFWQEGSPLPVHLLNCLSDFRLSIAPSDILHRGCAFIIPAVKLKKQLCYLITSCHGSWCGVSGLTMVSVLAACRDLAWGRHSMMSWMSYAICDGVGAILPCQLSPHTDFLFVLSTKTQQLLQTAESSFLATKRYKLSGFSPEQVINFFLLISEVSVSFLGTVLRRKKSFNRPLDSWTWFLVFFFQSDFLMGCAIQCTGNFKNVLMCYGVRC